MILIDTHVWIWWLSAPNKLSPRAAQAIKKAEHSSHITLLSLSCWEVAMQVAKGRIGFNMEVEAWIEKALATNNLRLTELSPKAAVYATRLPDTPPADPVDRLLIATSIVHHLPLVTKDQAIRNYPHVQTIW